MNTGLGFMEILVIITLILVFFGSKELPMFLREIAKYTAKARRYSDRIRREIDDVVRSTEPQPAPFVEQVARKKELRTRYLALRKKYTPEQRTEKSDTIIHHLLELDQIKNATMIMAYVDMGAEVQTRKFIRELLSAGKRVVIPYCIEGITDLGVAEIGNIDIDVTPGTMGIPEPRKELRRTFFKSDLQAVVCPGVAFDNNGGRLGRGKGYYDTYLRELHGRIPIVGIAFQCQIMTESLPFEYHDIAMDIIVTEDGVVFRNPTIPGDREVPAG